MCLQVLLVTDQVAGLQHWGRLSSVTLTSELLEDRSLSNLMIHSKSFFLTVMKILGLKGSGQNLSILGV